MWIWAIRYADPPFCRSGRTIWYLICTLCSFFFFFNINYKLLCIQLLDYKLVIELHTEASDPEASHIGENCSLNLTCTCDQQKGYHSVAFKICDRQDSTHNLHIRMPEDEPQSQALKFLHTLQFVLIRYEFKNAYFANFLLELYEFIGLKSISLHTPHKFTDPEFSICVLHSQNPHFLLIYVFDFLSATNFK